MRAHRDIPGMDLLEAITDGIARQTVLLQNVAEYGDFDRPLHLLQGIAAASHRSWRELNERLARAFVSPIEREDVSAFGRELCELSAALAQLAQVWHAAPPGKDSAAAWSAQLAEGGNLLRQLTVQLPLLRGENALADCAGELYALRQQADRRLAQELRSHKGEMPETALRFHACVTAFACLSDTAEWLALKNR